MNQETVQMQVSLTSSITDPQEGLDILDVTYLSHEQLKNVAGIQKRVCYRGFDYTFQQKTKTSFRYHCRNCRKGCSWESYCKGAILINMITGNVTDAKQEHMYL
jgi:hypothetical protein